MVRHAASANGRARRHVARSRRLALVAVPVVAALALSACSGKPKDDPSSSSGAPSLAHGSSSAAAGPAPAVTIGATSARAQIAPATPITVTAAHGTLTTVTLVNDEGKQVSGELAPEGASWKSTEKLGYGKSYTLNVRAVNADGVAASLTHTYTTVTPPNETLPYFQYTGAYALQNGATYGVGIVPIVHFDEPITDKKAAMAALKVTTSPAIAGAWYWSSDQDVHYRPKDLWPTGTKVTISADVYGRAVSPGLYGQADKSISFKIGDKHVAIADDNLHTVAVYFNDKLQRTMPTSMGRGGYVAGEGGQQISLWTMNGMYTVIAHENPAIMSSASYGLPANSPHGYGPEKIYFATKISVDGIYLHQLEDTVWAQGNTDVSHGCLNLNTDNSSWYFQTSQIGDVVLVRNTGGPTIQLWQGGEWSVPWSTWSAGGLDN